MWLLFELHRINKDVAMLIAKELHKYHVSQLNIQYQSLYCAHHDGSIRKSDEQMFWFNYRKMYDELFISSYRYVHRLQRLHKGGMKNVAPLPNRYFYSSGNNYTGTWLAKKTNRHNQF